MGLGGFAATIGLKATITFHIDGHILFLNVPNTPALNSLSKKNGANRCGSVLTGKSEAI